MNIQVYHKLLANPTLLNKDTLKDIEDLVKNFPMVENFRILLALNLLILDDYRYEQAITQAAIYSSDRKRLKEWVDYIIQKLDAKEETQTELPKTETSQDPENVEPIASTEIVDEIRESEKEQINEVPKITPEEIKQEDQVDQSQNGTNKLALTEQKDKQELQDLESEKKNIRSKKELLKLVRKRLDEIEAEKSNKIKSEIEENGKTLHNKLIDRFIEQEPSISRPDKNEFFNPQNEAVESSIDEDDFFVTETLAQIHAQQANFKKAEEIYRKLILKNPEKSSYFAAQIEKLTKK